MRPLFNVPGEGAFALVLGIISGYPIGAKTVANLKENGICSDVEAERLISFTNNSGPLFVIGTVGISIFLDVKIGFLLLLAHILAALTVGFIFRFWKRNYKLSTIKTNTVKSNEYNNKVSFYNLGEILYKSIFNSIISVVMIGGFIVLFSVIVSMLSNSKIIYIIATLLSPLFSVVRYI
jgi:sporulation integral membrane protein YlbJ